MRKDFNYLCHDSVEEWFYVSSAAGKGLNDVEEIENGHILRIHTEGASYLTHWSLRDVVEILKVLFPNICCRVNSWVYLVKLLSAECHGTPVMISQH